MAWRHLVGCWPGRQTKKVPGEAASDWRSKLARFSISH
jgi:hypothetical protein